MKLEEHLVTVNKKIKFRGLRSAKLVQTGDVEAINPQGTSSCYCAIFCLFFLINTTQNCLQIVG